MIKCFENQYMVKECFSQIASKSKDSRCEEKLTGAVLFSGQSLGKKVPRGLTGGKVIDVSVLTIA